MYRFASFETFFPSPISISQENPYKFLSYYLTLFR